MVRTRAVVRQWTLLRVLSQHAEGLSIEDMARHTAVNPRTIRRDLRLFGEAGIPLRETVCARNKKIWRIDRNGVKALANHSNDECLALLVAEVLLRPLRGTRFFAAFARCRDRVLANMNHSLRTHVENQVKAHALEHTNRAFTRRSAEDLEDLWDTLLANGSVMLAWSDTSLDGRQNAVQEATQSP